jgi:HSP20 family protein
MERDLDQLFGHIYSAAPESRVVRKTLSPAIDVYEKDNQVHVQAELPGIPKESVSIEINGNVLTLSGESKQSKEYTKENIHYQERSFGSFQRRIALPEGVTADGATASYDNGILHISVPKVVSHPPIKIAIQ